MPMLDLSILKRRFREFGGWRLVKEYARLGLIPVIVKSFYKAEESNDRNPC